MGIRETCRRERLDPLNVDHAPIANARTVSRQNVVALMTE